jgi:hypothetical protein
MTGASQVNETLRKISSVAAVSHSQVVAGSLRRARRSRTARGHMGREAEMNYVSDPDAIADNLQRIAVAAPCGVDKVIAYALGAQLRDVFTDRIEAACARLGITIETGMIHVKDANN